MSSKVLGGRRRIAPAESVPAVAPGWELTFKHPGLPFLEPGFATIHASADPSAAVHGVAHRITPAQFAHYLNSEGVRAGSEGDAAAGYFKVSVPLRAYDGRALAARSLSTGAAGMARLRGRAPRPSARYLGLLRAGAAEFGLDADYRATLDAMEHYEHPTGFRGRVAKFVMGALLFLIVMPSFQLLGLYRKLRPDAPPDGLVFRIHSAFFERVRGATWALADMLEGALGFCGVTGTLRKRE